MTQTLERRVTSVEERQDTADERFNLILNELQEAKKERAEIREDVCDLRDGLNRLLTHNGLAPLPPSKRDEELAEG